jgi:hypothetical protein
MMGCLAYPKNVEVKQGAKITELSSKHVQEVT